MKSLTTACAVVLLAISAFAQQKQTLTNEQALNLLRTINTAEVEAKFMRPGKQFTDLEGIKPALSRYSSVAVVTISAGTGPENLMVGDHQVRLVLSPDRQHYTATLISPDKCSAYFSDESGVIYEGARALGCGEPQAQLNGDKQLAKK